MSLQYSESVSVDVSVGPEHDPVVLGLGDDIFRGGSAADPLSVALPALTPAIQLHYLMTKKTEHTKGN